MIYYPDGRLPDADGEQVETERIEALQAALTSIINSHPSRMIESFDRSGRLHAIPVMTCYALSRRLRELPQSPGLHPWRSIG